MRRRRWREAVLCVSILKLCAVMDIPIVAGGAVGRR
jgi:hypothetical protein